MNFEKTINAKSYKELSLLLVEEFQKEKVTYVSIGNCGDDSLGKWEATIEYEKKC